MAECSSTEVSEGTKLIIGIINTLNQRIFIRWTTTGLIDILTHNVVQVNERVLTYTWHERIARLLNCGVKRNGKCELLWLRSKTLNHWNNTAGRHRNMASTNTSSIGGVKASHGCKSGVVVHERLTLAHKNNTGNARVKVVTDVHNLLIDFTCRKGTSEASSTRCAESAAHGAARLRGSAD